MISKERGESGCTEPPAVKQREINGQSGKDKEHGERYWTFEIRFIQAKLKRERLS